MSFLQYRCIGSGLVQQDAEPVSQGAAGHNSRADPVSFHSQNSRAHFTLFVSSILLSFPIPDLMLSPLPLHQLWCMSNTAMKWLRWKKKANSILPGK